MEPAEPEIQSISGTLTLYLIIILTFLFTIRESLELSLKSNNNRDCWNNEELYPELQQHIKETKASSPINLDS
jgi:hypothetical protein